MQDTSIGLVIEGTYPWYRGGVSEWIYQYIRSFPYFRFHILQVATDPYLQADFSSTLYPLPSQVHSFSRLAPPDLQQPAGDGWASRWFREIYNDIPKVFCETGLIHVTNTGFAGWLGMKLAKLYSIPLVLTEHALYWKEVEMGAKALECGYKIPESGEEKQYMVKLFMEMAGNIYKEADEIVSVSKCNTTHQKALGARKVHYIPNGVDARWLQAEKARGEVPVIGWIGRCAEMKNPLKFFDVIDAFKSSSVTPWFVMMLCDANEAGLRRQVVKKARHYPKLKVIWNEPAEKHISNFDALCITSHNESQPLVMFEALAKKVLPMGWQTGDVTSTYGLTVPYNATPAALIKRFEKTWSDPEKWKNEVDKRFAMVQARHTWQHIFCSYSRLFAPYLSREGLNETY